jgi:hypothetical protein
MIEIKKRKEIKTRNEICVVRIASMSRATLNYLSPESMYD